MISSICDSIITELGGITNVKKVGAWAGDLDTLLSMPQNMPGLYLVYQTAKFAQAPATMGTVKVDSVMKFQILLIVSSLKNPSTAATTAWGIIEAVRTALIGLQISTYNNLWPESEELVFSEGGLLVYGMNYSLDVRV
jgi:hypothetical protein